MTDREGKVLNALIREYVRTGRPVGSGRLARSYPENLSPATLRNVMSDLETKGLLKHPHTSAGRTPTLDGYRHYVDSLLNSEDLPIPEVDRIQQILESERDPGKLLNKTSQLLSTVSNNVGFVLAPPVSSTSMKEIKFVRIGPQRVLVILVAASGWVQHRLIELDQDFQQTELDEAGRYLVTHFAGKTVLEIRRELLRLMMEERSLYSRMLKNAVLLSAAGLVRCEGEKEDEDFRVYLGSTSCLMQKPEASDMDRIGILFQTLEERPRLAELINDCLQPDSQSPSVNIGLEEHIPGMRHFALITSPYLYDDRAVGGLGILGPCRMEYEKAIGLVGYVAKLVGRLLSSD